MLLKQHFIQLIGHTQSFENRVNYLIKFCHLPPLQKNRFIFSANVLTHIKTNFFE